MFFQLYRALIVLIWVKWVFEVIGSSYNTYPLLQYGKNFSLKWTTTYVRLELGSISSERQNQMMEKWKELCNLMKWSCMNIVYDVINSKFKQTKTHTTLYGWCQTETDVEWRRLWIALVAVTICVCDYISRRLHHVLGSDDNSR